MKLKYIFPTILLLSATAELSLSQSMIINNTKDAYICDCEPNKNFGKGAEIYQGPYYTGGHKCYTKVVSYWSLDSIPKGLHITSATIEFKCKERFGTLTGQMVFYRLTQDWDETKITDATAPSYTTQDSIVSDWPAQGEWLSIDATKLVQFWYAHPDSNFGLYGHSANTTSKTGIVGLYSAYNSSINYRPKLTIKYSTTDVGLKETTVPSNFKLTVFPDPFNPITYKSYTLTQSGRVTPDVLDLESRMLDRLINSFQSIGEHHIQWIANRYVSGIYLIALSGKKS